MITKYEIVDLVSVAVESTKFVVRSLKFDYGTAAMKIAVAGSTIQSSYRRGCSVSDEKII